jgi:hypothetical protein
MSIRVRGAKKQAGSLLSTLTLGYGGPKNQTRFNLEGTSNFNPRTKDQQRHYSPPHHGSVFSYVRVQMTKRGDSQS